MGMNLGSPAAAEPDVLVEMNTTPLIDVMLVLLIMLIITIPMQLHSVKLDLPNGPPPRIEKPAAVRIDVGPAGEVSWNGERLPDRASLEARLRAAAAQAVQPELHLRPDQAAPYGAVMGVMATAQRLGLAQLAVVSGAR